MSDLNSGLYMTINNKNLLLEDMTDEELEKRLSLCKTKNDYEIIIKKLVKLIRIMKYKRNRMKKNEK